jgi:NitT/TauT family transport system substrate-binding protein
VSKCGFLLATARGVCLATWSLAAACSCASERPAEAAGAGEWEGSGAGVQLDEPVALQLQWYPQAQFAGYMVAQRKGFFRQMGLDDVRLEWGSAEIRPLERLAEGEVDFSTAWLSTAITERARGRPIVEIAQVLRRSSMMLVARSDSGIGTPAGMSGHRVGLWGGEFDVPPNAFFKKHSVQPVVVPQSNSMVPFLRRAVDIASVMYYNEYHQLLEAGLRESELRVFALADYGIDFPEDGIYCRDTTRRQRPETCAAVATAVRRGWQYAFAHEPETLEVVMDYCSRAHVRTNRAHQRWMLRAMKKAMADPASEEAWGSLPPEVYAGVAGALRDQGLIEGIPEFAAFYRPPAQRRDRP